MPPPGEETIHAQKKKPLKCIRLKCNSLKSTKWLNSRYLTVIVQWICHFSVFFSHYFFPLTMFNNPKT